MAGCERLREGQPRAFAGFIDDGEEGLRENGGTRWEKEGWPKAIS